MKASTVSAYEDSLACLTGARTGLVGNHTSVGQDLTHLIDAFRGADGIHLTTLFAPEHGFYGEMDVQLDSATDPHTDLPIHSLYGDQRAPTQEMLEGIDVLVFSIQDVGVRFYTYISTMFHCMAAAAANGIRFLVIDRPNPITGTRLEGNVTEVEFQSFVSVRPLPIRHGMTIGELAMMFNEVYGIGADLTVAKMSAWNRAHWFDQTGWPWVMPSPAMPTLDTAIVYPGTCLYEGMSISIGRGTSRPFELIGAPWIEPFALADEMNAKGLDGAYFRPTYFVPTYRTHEGVRCAGIQIHVTDREIFRPVAVAMHLLVQIRNNHPGDFEWGQEERVNRKFGSDRVRRQIEAGLSVEEMLSEWEEERKGFEEVRERYLIY